MKYILQPKETFLTSLEAKPCPFCGEQPTIQPWHGGPPSKRIVECVNDNCKISPEVTGHTRVLAVAEWNTRPQVPKTAPPVPETHAGRDPSEQSEAVRKLVEAARRVKQCTCSLAEPQGSCPACLISEALKPFAPAYVQALEQQSANDAGDAPVVRIPRP